MKFFSIVIVSISISSCGILKQENENSENKDELLNGKFVSSYPWEEFENVELPSTLKETSDTKLNLTTNTNDECEGPKLDSGAVQFRNDFKQSLDRVVRAPNQMLCTGEEIIVGNTYSENEGKFLFKFTENEQGSLFRIDCDLQGGKVVRSVQEYKFVETGKVKSSYWYQIREDNKYNFHDMFSKFVNNPDKMEIVHDYKEYYSEGGSFRVAQFDKEGNGTLERYYNRNHVSLDQLTFTNEGGFSRDLYYEEGRDDVTTKSVSFFDNKLQEMSRLALPENLWKQFTELKEVDLKEKYESNYKFEAPPSYTCDLGNYITVTCPAVGEPKSSVDGGDSGQQAPCDSGGEGQNDDGSSSNPPFFPISLRYDTSDNNQISDRTEKYNSFSISLYQKDQIEVGDVFGAKLSFFDQDGKETPVNELAEISLPASFEIVKEDCEGVDTSSVGNITKGVSKAEICKIKSVFPILIKLASSESESSVSMKIKARGLSGEYTNIKIAP